MAYFDDEDNVRAYEQMAESVDSSELRREFLARLGAGRQVLELGMGPGKDLDGLAEAGLEVLGSDASSVFLERYKRRGGSQRVQVLGAVDIPVAESFDGVYSNKVLHHLTRAEFRSSLRRQQEILRPGGLAFHSLWRGDRTEEHHGMLFTYWEADQVAAALPEGLVLEASGLFCEIWEGDSLWIAIRHTLTFS